MTLFHTFLDAVFWTRFFLVVGLLRPLSGVCQGLKFAICYDVWTVFFDLVFLLHFWRVIVPFSKDFGRIFYGC